MPRISVLGEEHVKHLFQGKENVRIVISKKLTVQKNVSELFLSNKKTGGIFDQHLEIFANTL